MATAATDKIREQLSIIVKCAICQDTFSDPRQLPCLHTYCLVCIEGLCRDNYPEDEVPCPLCTKNFTIPVGGVGSLPKNFNMVQLMEIASPMSTRPQGCSCSVDGGEKSEQPCAVCSKRLSESCYSHLRVTFAVTRQHELVEVKGERGSKTPWCDKHTDKPLELYCFNCKKVTCVKCLKELHRLHELSHVDEVAEEFRKQMTSDVEVLCQTLARCCESINKRKYYQVEFKNKLDVIKNEVKNCAKYLTEMMEIEKQNLLTELDAIGKERNKQMNIAVGEIEHHASFVGSMITYTEQLRDKGTACDVAQQTSALHLEAGKLTKLDVFHQAINNLDSDDFTFTPATWPTQSHGSKVVGEIEKKLSHSKLLTRH